MRGIKLIFKVLTAATLTLALPLASHAECFCEFINGVVQPMCGSSLDIRPSCGYLVRERGPVLFSPPPFRVESCKPAVLCNKHGACRWKWVCD
jgi:hypothetical protein